MCSVSGSMLEIYFVTSPQKQTTDVSLVLGGFPLNISPLPIVQNSSKVIHSQNLFDKSLLFEIPAIAYLIYDEKHGFPISKISHV